MFHRRLLASLGVFIDFARVSFQTAYGVWKIARLPRPRVTIFGGSKIDLSHPYALQAMELAQKLVDNNISVLTGGGPGIMQSANCGAISEKSKPMRSMGIAVKGLDDKELNKCVQELVTVKYFYARKWLLTQYSDGFAIFPGGYGTLDELAEIATLMQTGFLGVHPIVLINSEYWKPFLDWVNNSALKNGLLKDKDKNLLFVTDDIDQAVEMLKKSTSTKIQMGM
jgi:uncharacterized protein (TIGR00730 family)